MKNCPLQNVPLIFLPLFHPTFATAVIWPDYGLGKQISVPVMLWHGDYNGHRPFAATLTSFYLHMLERAGPVWAIPLRGVKIIPGPWEESCLLIQFHAQKFPSSLEGIYRLLFYVDFPTRPLRRALSVLLSNMHTQNNTAVRQCLQCVGRRCLTPIQKDQEASCKVQLLCSHPLPLCVSNTHL